MLNTQILRQSRALSRSSHSLPQLLQQSQRSQFSRLSFPSSRYTAIHPSRIGRRWQSTEAAEKPSEGSTTADSAETPAEKEDPLKLELEKKNKEVIDLKDKYLRSVADYRNLQDRTKRDMDSARQFAIQRFATDLLDSIDNLDRALSSVPEAALKGSSTTTSSDSSTPSEPNKDLQMLHGGLKMTDQILMTTLKKHGLERFDPTEGEGRKFDPNQDEATFFTKVEGKNDGDVFYTQSKGFRLNGRVIRAAKVGVVKNS